MVSQAALGGFYEHSQEHFLRRCCRGRGLAHRHPASARGSGDALGCAGRRARDLLSPARSPVDGPCGQGLAGRGRVLRAGEDARVLQQHRSGRRRHSRDGILRLHARSLRPAVA